jgi:hypothetical protein
MWEEQEEVGPILLRPEELILKDWTRHLRPLTILSDNFNVGHHSPILLRKKERGIFLL